MDTCGQWPDTLLEHASVVLEDGDEDTWASDGSLPHSEESSLVINHETTAAVDGDSRSVELIGDNEKFLSSRFCSLCIGRKSFIFVSGDEHQDLEGFNNREIAELLRGSMGAAEQQDILHVSKVLRALDRALGCRVSGGEGENWFMLQSDAVMRLWECPAEVCSAEDPGDDLCDLHGENTSSDAETLHLGPPLVPEPVPVPVQDPIHFASHLFLPFSTADT